MKLAFFVIALVILAASATASDDNTYLYDARFVQAAPGKLLDLIARFKSGTGRSDSGDEPPLMIRHSQGDRWDLMLLFPMASYGDYYRAERAAKRKRAERDSGEALNGMIAWQEDLFVYGPPFEKVREAFSKAGFFHLEIFQSLPGKEADLLKEREMENAYQRALKRPENFIFVRDRGAAWELFTVGCYRNLKHYAESADIPEADQEAAAKGAGFESASRIGPYLRTLIALHHDTLAVAVK